MNPLLATCMNGPRVMCSGCTAVEVPVLQPFCEHCSALVLAQLSVPLPTTPPQPNLIQVGPTDL